MITKQLGQLLLESGDVRAADLSHALRIQRFRGGQIGRILCDMGMCSEMNVAQALLRQSRVLHSLASSRTIVDIGATRPQFRVHPRLTALVLGTSDLLCLCAASVLAAWLVDATLFRQQLPVLALFVLTFIAQQLYPAIAFSAAEEFRRAAVAVSLVYLSLSVAAMISGSGAAYYHYVLVAWISSVIAVPVGRSFTRRLFAARPWWGYPAVVLGTGKSARSIIEILRREPGLGLKPVAVLDDGALRGRGGRPTHLSGVPIIGELHLASLLASELGISVGILATPTACLESLQAGSDPHTAAFSRLLAVPNLEDYLKLPVTCTDLGGTLGIEVRQQLLLPGPRILKRVLDVLATVIGGIPCLPLLAIIGLLVKLDSRGPAFYIQQRLGRNKCFFNAVKFRTMHGDGEQRLAGILAQDPVLREEYERYHKLEKDPRVTRIGYFLRKYRLDELPQLWNVLRGEMSLVGPRPYLERELGAMETKEEIILKAPPGLTGMWQISDRGRASFHDRVQLDVCYVRNWSPWLDAHILLRTVSVVLRGTGS
jgi:Undecaprenyl-phosphate galactose phosphotransferase WbaP